MQKVLWKRIAHSIVPPEDFEESEEESGVVGWFLFRAKRAALDPCHPHLLFVSDWGLLHREKGRIITLLLGHLTWSLLLGWDGFWVLFQFPFPISPSTFFLSLSLSFSKPSLLFSFEGISSLLLYGGFSLVALFVICWSDGEMGDWRTCRFQGFWKRPLKQSESCRLRWREWSDVGMLVIVIIQGDCDDKVILIVWHRMFWKKKNLPKKTFSSLLLLCLGVASCSSHVHHHPFCPPQLWSYFFFALWKNRRSASWIERTSLCHCPQLLTHPKVPGSSPAEEFSWVRLGPLWTIWTRAFTVERLVPSLRNGLFARNCPIEQTGLQRQRDLLLPYNKNALMPALQVSSLSVPLIGFSLSSPLFSFCILHAFPRFIPKSCEQPFPWERKR